MGEYAPGMRAIIRDEEWLIKKVEKNNKGEDALYCSGITPLVKDKEAIFLDDLEDVKIVNPAEIKLVKDTSPHFIKSKLYFESKWRTKIPTDNLIHIGHKAAMDSLDYQLEPARLALSRPRQRILIADAVGLGKTLEAGILISELIERGKGKRILVVTVKSMMMQIQKELWNRFTIPLVRLDSSKIASIRSKLPTNYNPFFYYDKSIISIDTLKSDIAYRTHLENAYWDIIVIDEAQNVAQRGEHSAQRAKLAKLLADRSDTMIMLSATPHDGRRESFASLMNILDPTAIANPKDYTKDDIKGIFIRRFKKDLKNLGDSSFLERKFECERSKASKNEEIAFDVFVDMKLQMDINKTRNQGRLFKTTLEKALFSSPAACIKSIENRLKKLRNKYTDDDIKDINELETLKDALLKITPHDFSKYQHLLHLLKSSEYNWKAQSDDRIVIFTERIETMNFLYEQLKKDLTLKNDAIQKMSGDMSDIDQQKIVEDFGRDESPVRILIASDVASEGLNLHYKSHRLIHFDIPWSLMVFQQRNGRIDRYGQKERPDIRYLLVESQNSKIKGDYRIIEILIQKEEQALKNIGDPSMLLGKFSIEDEEDEIYKCIEKNDSDYNLGSKALEELLNSQEKDFDPLEELLRGASQDNSETHCNNERPKDDKTIFSDLDYLFYAFNWLNQENYKGKFPIRKLQNVSGLEITVKDDLEARLKALLPKEARPKGEYLNLSSDIRFCMDEMKRSMQNNLEDDAWPKFQYLWKLHPIFSWVNDKISLVFKRDEAPIIAFENSLKSTQTIFVVNGSIPNRKSVALIYEWFGLLYENNKFESVLSMNEVLKLTRFKENDIPNTNKLTDDDVTFASKLLLDVIEKAKDYLTKCHDEYQEKMKPLLDEELDKLDELELKQKNYQLSLLRFDRQKTDKERQIDEIFNKFVNWVTDTLTIQNSPYIRIISVFKGMAK